MDGVGNPDTKGVVVLMGVLLFAAVLWSLIVGYLGDVGLMLTVWTSILCTGFTMVAIFRYILHIDFGHFLTEAYYGRMVGIRHNRVNTRPFISVFTQGG